MTQPDEECVIRDDDYNDYLCECAMNRIMERGKSPCCLSAEQYCMAFMRDSICACEDCNYCKGYREQDNNDDDMDDMDVDDSYRVFERTKKSIEGDMI